MSSPSAIECTPEQRVTRSLLGYGLLAGPFYIIASVIEGIAHRDDGFRFTRDDWSLLAAGPDGWVHQLVFVITGLMVVAAGVGVARAMAGRWAGPLLAVYGLGLVAAGIFVADGNGDYPAGSAADGSISGHGMGHLVAAMIGFVAAIAATFVVASQESHNGHRSFATVSRVVGMVFLVGFIGVGTGSTSAPIVLGFTAAVAILWAWLATLSLRLFHRVLSAEHGSASTSSARPTTAVN